jgi:hypothetical protein
MALRQLCLCSVPPWTARIAADDDKLLPRMVCGSSFSGFISAATAPTVTSSNSSVSVQRVCSSAEALTLTALGSFYLQLSFVSESDENDAILYYRHSEYMMHHYFGLVAFVWLGLFPITVFMTA